MIFAASPYVFPAIFLVIVLVIASLYAFMMAKGQNKEAENNTRIAEQAGVRYIHRPTEQPTGFFDVYKYQNRMASHLAIDPQTNDWSMQLWYHIPPAVIHLKGDNGEDHNLSFATVTTGFWIVDNIVIFPKPRLGRFKGRYLTGNEEFDKKWVVSSKNPQPLPAIMTPGVINTLMHPPFEFKKSTKITFRGPQMAIETQLVEFEKRVALLRWCQNLISQVDTANAPGYGQFRIEPQYTSGNELPSTVYSFPDGNQPPLGADIGIADIEETDDAQNV